MEARKVQRFGSNSMSICLPKVWTKRNDIQPGSTLYFSPLADGGLAVRYFREQRGLPPRSKAYNLETDGLRKPGLLTRMLIGSYVAGHESVVLTAKERLSEAHLKEVHDVASRLNGYSIMEEAPNSITLQIAIELEKFNLTTLLRRMVDLISTMYELAVEALRDPDPSGLEELKEIEREVDKLYWVALRYILASQRQVELGLYHTHTPALELIGDRTIFKCLENAADYVRTIVKSLNNRSKNNSQISEPLDQESYQKLKQICQMGTSMLKDSVTALLESDVELASDLISRKSHLTSLVVRFQEGVMASQYKPPNGVLVIQFASNFSSLAINAITISEIAINRFLEGPNPSIHPLAIGS